MKQNDKGLTFSPIHDKTSTIRDGPSKTKTTKKCVVIGNVLSLFSEKLSNIVHFVRIECVYSNGEVGKKI